MRKGVETRVSRAGSNPGEAASRGLKEERRRVCTGERTFLVVRAVIAAAPLRPRELNGTTGQRGSSGVATEPGHIHSPYFGRRKQAERIDVAITRNFAANAEIEIINLCSLYQIICEQGKQPGIE